MSGHLKYQLLNNVISAWKKGNASIYYNFLAYLPQNQDMETHSKKTRNSKHIPLAEQQSNSLNTQRPPCGEKNRHGQQAVRIRLVQKAALIQLAVLAGFNTVHSNSDDKISKSSVLSSALLSHVTGLTCMSCCITTCTCVLY